MGGRTSPSYSISRDFEGTSSDCALLARRTDLLSVNVTVLSGVSPGDVLDVRLDNTNTKVNAQTSSGAIAGLIVIPEQSQLIKCLKDGVRFKADVLTISGSTCNVEVKIR